MARPRCDCTTRPWAQLSVFELGIGKTRWVEKVHGHVCHLPLLPPSTHIIPLILSAHSPLSWLLKKMDIPEIRTSVGWFLQPPDLAVAAAVCRSWNATFTPILYWTITWAYHGKKPGKDAVMANTHHIRRLDVESNVPGFSLSAFQACTRIEALDIKNWGNEPRDYDELSAIIRQNLGVKTLHLTDYSQSLPLAFMQVLSTCTALRSLSIQSTMLLHLNLILDAAVRLESLCIRCRTAEPLGLFDEWPCFPSLKTLELDLSDLFPFGYQLAIVRKCSRLKSLTWHIYKSKPDLDLDSSFKTLIRMYCPDVESLQIHCSTLQDTTISQILDDSRRIISLKPCSSQFGNAAFQSLIRHFSYLQELDLQLSDGLTSKMAREILTSCPSLVFFHGVNLHVRDILGIKQDEEEELTNSRTELTCRTPDWVCTGLRRLSFFICGLEGKPLEWHRRVFQQLAKMECLEYLVVGSLQHVDGGPSGDGLDVRLEAGLDVLSSLRRLSTFGYNVLQQRTGKQDLEWMINAWPKLVQCSDMSRAVIERYRANRTLPSFTNFGR
ncbi:hypothetical protein B0O80DRAFT_136204 [Mortierella sp. GBAus27b]|nr:hypothetical protein B0O80DRAFT_136204 [Mortierella sp. GBAus27b]